MGEWSEEFNDFEPDPRITRAIERKHMKSDSGVVMIHGKAYTTVASRVAKFRQEGTPTADWAITTEVLFRDPEVVVMKASIADEKGRIIATGHAEEVRASSQINKTSALENAETSAIGRALAALGMAGTEFASADEVAQAIKQQGVHRPSDGAMESLPPDIQMQARDVAMEVIGFMEKGKILEAAKWIKAANFQPEAEIAMWALLPSGMRAALKKHQASARAFE